MVDRIGPKRPSCILRRVAPKLRELYNKFGSPAFPRPIEYGKLKLSDQMANFDKYHVAEKMIRMEEMTAAQLDEQHRKLVYLKEADSEGEILEGAKSVEEVARLLSEQTRTLFGPDAMAVIVNRKGNSITQFSEGVQKAVLDAEVRDKTGILSLAVANNHTLYIPDLSGQRLFYGIPYMNFMDEVYETTLADYGATAGQLPKAGFRSVMAVPIFYDPSITKEGCMGILFIGSNRANAWDAIVDLPPVRLLANFAGTPLKNLLTGRSNKA